MGFNRRKQDGRGRRSVRDSALSSRDLAAMVDQTSATTFNVTSPDLPEDEAAILGRFNNFRCHSGLCVHATDTVEAHTLSAEWQMPPACSVAVLLEGSLSIEMDGAPMQLCAADQDTSVSGHIWSATKPARILRHLQKGTRVRKVVITVPWKWIDEVLSGIDLPNENLARFSGQHGVFHAWRPSSRAQALAELIVNADYSKSPLDKISVESRAIEILREGLESVIMSPRATGERPGQTKAQMKARAVRSYVIDHLPENPTLAVMARELGMSIGAKQNAFKQAYGETIAEFSRDLRLVRAREALERDGQTIAQAAFEAGYSNPANFATAFKRRFGITPSSARA